MYIHLIFGPRCYKIQWLYCGRVTSFIIFHPFFSLGHVSPAPHRHRRVSRHRLLPIGRGRGCGRHRLDPALHGRRLRLHRHGDSAAGAVEWPLERGSVGDGGRCHAVRRRDDGHHRRVRVRRSERLNSFKTQGKINRCVNVSMMITAESESE